MRSGDDRAGLDALVVHVRALAVGGRRGVLEIVDRLTPYVAETLFSSLTVQAGPSRSRRGLRAVY
jgi:hypothetical protein